jgi:hypothetical protein
MHLRFLLSGRKETRRTAFPVAKEGGIASESRKLFGANHEIYSLDQQPVVIPLAIAVPCGGLLRKRQNTSLFYTIEVRLEFETR